VLKAMGMPDSFCRSGLRISLGREHTADDIRTLCDRLRNVVHQLKPLAAKGDPS
jgi:cysteine sulfinate desulfinase/cysteine desulfurase-like protein